MIAVTTPEVKHTYQHPGLLPYMERVHERLNSPKTLKFSVGKNLNKVIKDIKELNIIPKSSISVAETL